MRLVVGMSGATGAIYGIRLLQVLSQMRDVETHLVMSKWAEVTTSLETTYSVKDVRKLADAVYLGDQLTAPISSGSFPVDAMVVVPCSMKAVASIRMGLSDNLLTRAADVTIKEQRKLILVPRETPLSQIHLENMLGLARMGAVILPPMPAFYLPLRSIDDVVDHTVARILDQLKIPHALVERWGGVCETPVD